MRITNDLNRYSNNSYSQNSPSFGAVYTKSSIKLLKSFIPDMIMEDGFEFAQKAINNLAQAGKRKDNLILKFKDVDELGVGRLEVHAKHLSDKVNSFSKINIPVESIDKKESQAFESLTAIVNSDSFVSKANSALVENEKLSQPQKLKNFINEKIHDFSEKIENRVNSFSEELFCMSENGPMREWTIFEDLKYFGKRLFRKNQNLHQYNDKQKEESEILAGIIDKLPILNK